MSLETWGARGFFPADRRPTLSPSIEAFSAASHRIVMKFGQLVAPSEQSQVANFGSIPLLLTHLAYSEVFD